MTKVRVLNVTCVLLSPHDGVPPEPVKLSFLDASWISFLPQERLLLFSTERPIPSLTLAGKFTHVDSTSDLVISFSGDGEDGVDYIWAEAEGIDFQLLTDDKHYDIESFLSLVLFLDASQLPAPVFSSPLELPSFLNRNSPSLLPMCSLIFAAYCRFHLDPPVEDRYFGNCIKPCEAVAKASELLAGGNEGFKAACAAVQKARWITNPFPRGLQMNRLVIVAGSPRFRVYDVDFGWGGARRVEMVSPDGNREAALLAARGGVQLSVSTSRLCMDALASSFVDGLQA
ncbi:unnamed protein product [Spirodela intermedia]|uniref:Uncharacterized protein n=1 Tax=Spirodela intermedia TaxID=51605 RepID=A0A7I8L921_SPIIN|nr:unnamed protein product [Spirodela intermedia]